MADYDPSGYYYRNTRYLLQDWNGRWGWWSAADGTFSDLRRRTAAGFRSGFLRAAQHLGFGIGGGLAISGLSYATSLTRPYIPPSRTGRIRDTMDVPQQQPSDRNHTGHLGIGTRERTDWRREQEVLDPNQLPRNESEIVNDLEQRNARHRQAQRTPGPHFVEEPLYYNPPGPVRSLEITTSTRLSTFQFALTDTGVVRNWYADINVSKVYEMLNFTGYGLYNAWNHDVQRYFAMYTYCHPIGFDVKIIPHTYPYPENANPWTVAYLDDGFNDSGPVNTMASISDFQDWCSQRYAYHYSLSTVAENVFPATQVWRWKVPSTRELWGEAVADDDRLDTKYDGTFKYPASPKLFTIHLGFLDPQRIIDFSSSFDIDVTQHLLFYQPRSVTDA